MISQKSTRIYLAIWRKAFLTNSTLTIPASNHSMAMTHRSGLYRAIRPYREGRKFDHELEQAAETFVVAIESDPASAEYPYLIRLKPRTSLAELEAALTSLGIEEEDLLLPSEKTLRDEILPPSPQRSNPFYTRED